MRQAGGTARTRVNGKGGRITQLPSHARLLHDVSKTPAPSSRSWRGRPDAIIVPATRPASALADLIELAADLETLLVVLCSRQAGIDQITERAGRTPRARAVVVHINDQYALPTAAFETSASTFRAANGGRTSDLSVKRNFGLLLARLCGWEKIVFIDDDITVSRSDLARLVYQLSNHQIAGMVCRRFPDNSVFCHARRLARFGQDVFVTGAVLGVNCSDLLLPFFPDIYNEDWFFFGGAAARHRLTKTGEALQAEYDPFSEPTRASQEEFGDLLAEGLYSLIEDRGPGFSFRQITHQANARYWSSFIDVRRNDLAETQALLKTFVDRESCSDAVPAAIKSLEAAGDLYGDNTITAERCVEFLEAWQQDITRWDNSYPRTNNVGSITEALSLLQVTNWRTVRWALSHSSNR
jgi:hypothetical protein